MQSTAVVDEPGEKPPGGIGVGPGNDIAGGRRLTDSARGLRTIFDHSPLGIARLDPEFRIIHANARFAEMLGSAGQDLSGRPAVDLLVASDRAVVLRQLAADRSEPDWAANGVKDFQLPDGSVIWTHWTASGVPAEMGRPAEILVMLEDVTAQRQAEQTTLANLREFERLNDLKSEFVGLVSHEFRTALTGIQGFSELIRDGKLSPDEMREFAGDINSDALRLNRMITEMLDLDRIESGKMSLRLVAVNLNEIIEECVARARFTSDIHQLDIDLDPALPQVNGDADRLVQVIANLLSNAIKYSPACGRVEIRSWAAVNQVVVEVEDHGEGIPADFIDRVFERFERYEASPTSRIIGTGLGLPIARQIIDLHGGRMWVESRVGIGSIFHFSLPSLAV